MFVIERGPLVKPDIFFCLFLPAACHVSFSRLGRVALSLQFCSTPKAQNRKKKQTNKQTNNLPNRNLGSAAVKPFPVRIVFFSRFCFLLFFVFSVLGRMACWKFSLLGSLLFSSRFWGGRSLRRCDGLPFYFPSEDVVSLYVRSLKRRVQKPNARNAAFRIFII